ncbi:MAG: FG-GAP-like repeat-containing protein, partial [Bacteroidales bacterium]|nr:FG-GAP-like repeat-containing protein [Bacteroidales bacterium]
KKIKYTGNGNQTPTNEIEFYYINRSDYFFKYIGGQQLYNKDLLTKIEVKSNSSLVKVYEFRYSANPITKLEEIIEKSGIGQRLNSTIIDWGTSDKTFTKLSGNNDIVVEFSVSSTGFFYDGDSNPNNNFNMEHFWSGTLSPLVGDFNGDGIKDFAVFYQYGNLGTNGKLQAFLGKKGGGFEASQQSDIENPYQSIKRVTVGDIDNDGKDDFIEYNSLISASQTYVSGNYNYYRNLFYSNTTQKYKFFDRKNFSGYIFSNVFFYPIQPVFGNFYGNGKTSLLVLENNLSSQSKTWYFNYFDNNNSTVHPSFNVTHTYFINHIYENNFSQQLDFDGDGTTDIFGVKNTSFNITELKFNASGQFSSENTLYATGGNTPIDIPSFQNPAKEGYYKFGDFNGDGKTDLLRYIENENKWQFCYSKGNTWEVNSQSNYKISPSFQYENIAIQTFAMDMDGDGICDFVERNGYQYIIWLTKGFNVFQKFTCNIDNSVSLNTLFFFGDFNGDGKIDLIYYDNNSKAFRVLYFMLNDKNNLVTKITDGLLYTDEFDYQPQTWTQNLSKDNTTRIEQQTEKFISPLQVVKSHKYSTGLTGTSSLAEDKYTFKNGWTNVQGKGFICFKQITDSNQVANTIIETSNHIPFDNSNFVDGTTTVKSLYNSQTQISGTTTEYLIKKMKNTLPDFYVAILPKYYEETNKLLSGNNTTTTITYENQSQTNGTFLGNISTVVSNYSNIYTITKTYSSYTNSGTWCNSKPQIIREKRTENGIDEGKQHTLSYDANGNIIQSITDSYPIAGGKTLTQRFSYDNYGNIVRDSISGIYGVNNTSQTRTTSYQYDTKGQFIKKITNPVGLITEYFYEPKFGNKTYEKDFLGNETTYEYDSFGNLKKITSPTSTTTITRNWENTVANNLAFNETSITTGGTNSTKFFDILRREVKTKTNLYYQDVYSKTEYNRDGTIYRESLPYFGTAPTYYKTYTYDNYKRCTTINALQLNTVFNYTTSSLTTNYPNGISETKTFNAGGEVSNITSTNGTISYIYNAFRKPKTITAEGIVTTMEYDRYGDQTKLIDANAGETNYVYNAFGELIKQTDAKGNEFTIYYDKLGRDSLKICNEPLFSTTYTYYTSGNSKGLLQKEQLGNGYFKQYTYNNLGYVTQMEEKIEGTSYFHKYSYDQYGRVETYQYPSGYKIYNQYDTHGFLTGVYENNGETPIWKLQGSNYVNEMGQLKEYYLGASNLKSTHSYNANFELTEMKTQKSDNSTIFDYGFSFTHNTGNLFSRTDFKKNPLITETFGYDNKQRLETWQNSIDNISREVIYENNGNIHEKSDAGTYEYDDEKPHAV